MSAWVAESGVTLGQVAVEAKSNEIVAIPELLAMLEIQGATVTIDAAGCQRKIAQAIVEKGANYLLSLKDNQPLLHQEVASYFDDALGSGVELPYHENVDKGHGRLEVRRVWTSTDIGWMSVRPGGASGLPGSRPRKLALGLLKNEPTDGKKSIARKRKRAGWDHEYLFQVLAAAAPAASSA